MAATDAVPVPRRNTAYRITFPIHDTSGDPVAGATVDTGVSIWRDGGVAGGGDSGHLDTGKFSEAGGGFYFLDLDTGDMAADTVALRIDNNQKITNAIIYPEELGDYRVNVGQIGGDTGAADRLLKFAGTKLSDSGTLDTGTVAGDTGAASRFLKWSRDKLTDSGTFDTGTGVLRGTPATLDTGATKDAVWQTAPGTDGRGLTESLNIDTGIADTVWKYSTSGATADTGSVGYAQGRLMAAHGDTGAVHLVSGRLAATDSGIVAAVVDTGKIAAAVWTNHATRVATSVSGNVDGSVASVTTVSANAIDTGSFTGTAAAANDTGALEAAISTGVWSHATRELTGFAFDTGIQQALARVDTGLSETIDRTLAKVDTGIANDVWGNASRTLTAFAHDTGIAQTVWREQRSTYTADTGSLGYGINVHYVDNDTGAAAHLAQMADEYDTGRLPAEATATLDTGAIKDAVWQTAPGVNPRTLTNIDTGAAIHLAQLADEHDTGRLQAEATATLDTGAVHDAVWNVIPGDSNRTLTNIDTGAAIHLAQLADEHDTGRLQAEATATLDTGATKDAVWGTVPGTSTRELTGSANIDTGIADTVWKAQRSGYDADTGSMGYATGNVTEIRGDTGAADNLSKVYDGAEGFYQAYEGPRGPGVYLNDAAANTNTVNGVDGTVGNPVSTIAAAKTISDSMSLDRIYLVNDSAVTFAADMSDYEVVGIGDLAANTVTLGNQITTNAAMHNVMVTGQQSSASGRMSVFGGAVTGVTGLSAYVFNSAITGNITLDASADSWFDNCWSAVMGNGTPIMTFDSAANVAWRHYSGGLQVNAMDTGNTMSYETDGQLVIGGDSHAGSITVRGNCTVTDTGTNTIIFTEGARIDQDQIADAVWDEEDTGHQVVGTMGFRQNDTGEVANAVWAHATRELTGFAFDTGIQQALTRVDTGLSETIDRILADTDTGLKTGLAVNVDQIDGDTGAANRLLKFAGDKVNDSGTLDTGTGISAAAAIDTGQVNQAVWQADASRTLTAAHDTGVLLEIARTDTGIRQQTDKLTFDTGANELHADIRKVNNIQVAGTGDTGLNDPWGPV